MPCPHFPPILPPVKFLSFLNSSLTCSNLSITIFTSTLFLSFHNSLSWSLLRNYLRNVRCLPRFILSKCQTTHMETWIDQWQNRQTRPACLIKSNMFKREMFPIYIYIYIYIYIQISVQILIYAYIPIYAYTHTHTHTYIYIYSNIYIYIYIQIYAYIHIYTNIHTYIYTYIHRGVQFTFS